MPSHLRALIVDDSAFIRRNIADILAEDPDIEIVGKAADGQEALRLALQLKPDLITLDLDMPRMDGFSFLRILMVRQPTPVIVISSAGSAENLKRLREIGTVEFIPKPEVFLSGDTPFRRALLDKIRHVRRLAPATTIAPPPPSSAGELAGPPSSVAPLSVRQPIERLIAIASPASGATALVDFLQRFPSSFQGALLVAQRMPDALTSAFTERLSRIGALRVSEAVHDSLVLARCAYVCSTRTCIELAIGPGGGEGLTADLRVRLSAPGKTERHVPSANRLFRSVAAVAGPRATAILFRGMGDDGVEGARAILEAGGKVMTDGDDPAAAL
jgi:two-component system chemotaxis response regulator CheB